MRKYEKTQDYWVYAHVLPTKLVYIGISKVQPCQRWQPLLYKNSSLAPYINEYGWKNIQHKVLIDSLTKEQAEQIEDRIIQALSINGLCINERRSGGLRRDNKKAYQKQYNKDHQEERKAYNKQWYEEHKEEKKQYREEHKEERKAYNKQRLSTKEGKIYNRVASYNRYHTPIETPKEAKQKYLEFGTIPSYIKNNDLK